MTDFFIHNYSSPAAPCVIAGPCSAESEHQVLDTARALADAGVTVFRAGLWKPRTRPGFFEGVGADGLRWLAEVKRTTGMAVATEVATPLHVERCLSAGIDILWIGARTSGDPFAMRALSEALRGAPSTVSVLIKNPLSPDIDAWIGAFERISAAGISRLGAVHRGYHIFGPSRYRNNPLWEAPLEFSRRMPEIPMIIDPSHMAGRRALVAPLIDQALDRGYRSFMIESHIDPDKALTDAAQQLTPAQLTELLHRINRKKFERA